MLGDGVPLEIHQCRVALRLGLELEIFRNVGPCDASRVQLLRWDASGVITQVEHECNLVDCCRYRDIPGWRKYVVSLYEFDRIEGHPKVSRSFACPDLSIGLPTASQVDAWDVPFAESPIWLDGNRPARFDGFVWIRDDCPDPIDGFQLLFVFCHFWPLYHRFGQIWPRGPVLL